MFYFQRKKAFSLIETLIAIAVLMIAVAGPLTIANRALNAALYSRNQATASYLAQETMEIMKNIRDNTVRTTEPTDPENLAWWLPTDLLQCITSYCDIYYTQNIDQFQSNTNCGNDLCQLYLSENGGYTSDETNGSASNFKRGFKITRVDDNPDSSDETFQLEVKVSWYDGVIPNEILLRSVLVGYVR